MEIGLAKEQDMPAIMEIIHQAQEYFRSQGIDQWQNNYPNEVVIRRDIELGESYVLTEEGQVIGTFMASFRGEPAYEKIYDGQWLTDGPYGVIHRVAVDNRVKGRGYAGEIIRFMERQCLERDNPVGSLRGDTHEQNRSMQRMFLKNGYRLCGTIYLADGSRRLAFEKICGAG